MQPPLTPGDPRLDGWYHTIDLGPGVLSSGAYDHRPVLGRYGFPEDLTGRRVLDVGAASGFFSFELERRGAAVTALDLAPGSGGDWVPTARREGYPGRHGGHFALAAEALGSRVEHRTGSIYDLSVAETGVFDLVFCGSLLLHLMHPMRALLALRAVTRERLIIETAHERNLEAQHPGEPVLRFGSRIYEEPDGLDLGSRRTYWWLTGSALAEMLEHAGFRDVEVGEPFGLPPTDFPVIVAHARP